MPTSNQTPNGRTNPVGQRWDLPQEDPGVVDIGAEPVPYQLEQHPFAVCLFAMNSPLRLAAQTSIHFRSPPTWHPSLLQASGVLFTAPRKTTTVRMVESNLRGTWVSQLLEEYYSVEWLSPSQALEAILPKLHTRTGPFQSPTALKQAFLQWCSRSDDYFAPPDQAFGVTHITGDEQVSDYIGNPIFEWINDSYPAYDWHIPGTVTALHTDADTETGPL